MPSRNVVREFAPDNYYHIYNRGVAKQPIFIDAADKQKFLDILERHLDPNNASQRYDGVRYRKFDKNMELLCYCLMGNHFHMLVYLKSEGQNISEFMRSVCTAYTMYFNKRHNRVGTLFQGVFKASRVSNDMYLQHITRYIHLNPRTYKTYNYSSLQYYIGKPDPIWLNTRRILGVFDGDDYLAFIEDYEAQMHMTDDLKYELADL